MRTALRRAVVLLALALDTRGTPSVVSPYGVSTPFERLQGHPGWLGTMRCQGYTPVAK